MTELEVFRDAPPAEVCRLLAVKVRDARVAAEESQEVFAERAGVALRTYTRFEKDGSATLETFVRVLRALWRTQYLLQLFPQPLPQTPVRLDAKIEHLRQLLVQARQSNEPIADLLSRLNAASDNKTP